MPDAHERGTPLQLNVDGPGVRGDQFTSVMGALHHIEMLFGNVLLNGVSIDLRRPDLEAGHWKAIGVSLNFAGDGKIWFGYSHPNALGVSPSLKGGRLVETPGIWLSEGANVRLDGVKISRANDPTMADIDRQRADADVVVTDPEGRTYTLPHRITLGHPFLINPGEQDGIFRPELIQMTGRLVLLQQLGHEVDGPDGLVLRQRTDAAQHHLDIFETCRAELAANTANPLGEPWTWNRVFTSQNAAAAFGYALAMAEEAVGSRRIALQAIKTRGRGGSARGEQLKAGSEAWKRQALPFAAQCDAAHPEWSRSKLATEILHHFDWEKPGHKAVEDWLRLEAEHPNGPLRSRARGTQKAG